MEEAPRVGAAVEALSDARCTIYALITSLAVGDAGETAVVVAYPRVVICVSLRTAARAEAPSSPMSLPPILQARDRMGTVREYVCQWALTRKRTLSGGGALEIGDLCLLEDCSERGGTLVSNAVVPDTARDGWGHRERAHVRVSAGVDRGER